jgi:PPP family 3-phenylpropionic acid transporter
MILRIPSGWISDKYGKRKPFLTSALILSSAVNLVYPFVSSFSGFLLLSLLTSVAELFIVGPTYNALLMDIIGEVEAGKRIGRYRVWGSVSWIVLQPVAGFLAKRFGLGLLFPIGGALSAVAAVITLFIDEPPREEKSGTMKLSSGLGQIKEYLVKRELGALIVARALAGIVGHGGFLDIYLTQMGAELDLIGLIKGLWVIPEVPSLLFFPRLSDRIGRWPIIALAFFTTPCVLFALSATTNIFLLVIVRIFSTFFTFGSSVVTTVYVSELAPSQYRSSIFAVTSTITGLSGMTGQYISGYLGDAYGLSEMYYVQSLFAILPATFFTFANVTRVRGILRHSSTDRG